MTEEKRKQIEDVQALLNDAVNHCDWDRVLVAVVKGADPHDRAPDGNGNDALRQAVESARLDIADALLRLGADVNVVGYRSGFGIAPLHAAVNSKQIKAVQFLLNAGAHVDVRDSYDSTPLILAASSGQREVVQELIEHGASMNAQNRAGDTPLHKAVLKNDGEMVKLLLRAGATRNISNNAGVTPAAIARSERHHAVSTLLNSAAVDAGIPI